MNIQTSNLVYNLLKKIEDLILSTLYKKVRVFGKYLFRRLGMTIDYKWMGAYYLQGKELSHMLKYV